MFNLNNKCWWFSELSSNIFVIELKSHSCTYYTCHLNTLYNKYGSLTTTLKSNKYVNSEVLKTMKNIIRIIQRVRCAWIDVLCSLSNIKFWIENTIMKSSLTYQVLLHLGSYFFGFYSLVVFLLLIYKSIGKLKFIR